ncbi:histidine kinase dimerization/phosphoacceptor domain -containing protein [Gracilinema caldarium]|uniref:histidine kinase dimerization/phosphoacceptor domain -containing protein n=1 Tax=Gracilinema caldarium TaxID=215591 RepID=UPI0026ED0419|nr:histidine kinase dimerization/phosphoacceptor domain -containing protein [Gracilinema caldarium]
MYHTIFLSLINVLTSLFSRGALRRTLLITLTVLLVFIFGFSWFFTARSLQNVSEKTLNDLAKRTSRIVFEEFSSHIANHESLIKTNTIIFEEASPFHYDDLLPLLEKELLAFPSVHIVCAGFSDGSYIEAQRLEEGTIRYGKAGKETAGDLVWYTAYEDGTLKEVDRRKSYDPRTRPWYVNALAAGTLSFSDPFTIVSTGNQVIAASIPFYAKNGTIHGVISVDFLLNDLAKTIADLAQEYQGYVAIRDVKGNLIFSSDGKQQEGYWPLPPLHETAKTLVFKGVPYRVLTHQYRQQSAASWFVTIALPENAFRAELYRNMVNMTILYVITFLVFAVLIYGIVVAVETPIHNFTRLVSRLSLEAWFTLDFSPEEDAMLKSIALRKNELGSLARSFENLLEKLRDTMGSLKQSLADKDVLLKEVHHRVKNNLQVIASLIHLEADKLDDEPFQAVLFELEEKVYAMSMVHETVYTSNSFSLVPMSVYLERLAHSLESYHSLLIPIFIETDADNVSLPLDRAITCALIIVELATNSFKYAFGRKTEGRITILLKEQGDEYLLAVEDNGCGFDAADKERIIEGTGVGSLITQALTAQIKGTMKLHTGPAGTRVEIRFPKQ